MPEDVYGEGAAADFVRYWLKERPDLEPAALALAMTFARLALLDMKSVSRISEAQGVTVTDYSLLATIRRGRNAGPTRPSDLSRMFNLPPSVVTYRITQLESRGLLRRSTMPGDRRVTLLTLTKAGARIVDAIVTAVSVRAGVRMKALEDTAGGAEALQRLMSALVRQWEQLDQATDEVQAR